MDCSLSGSSVHEEYWSGLPCPTLGDFPHLGIEPRLMSPALAGRFFTTSTTWEALSEPQAFVSDRTAIDLSNRIRIQHSMYPLGEPYLSWDENRVAFSSSWGYILVAAWLIGCIMVRISPVQLFATPHGLFCLSMGFSRQEYWSGLPFPTPGDLPDPGVEPESPVSPVLASRFFTTEPLGSPLLGSPRSIILGAFLVLN